MIPARLVGIVDSGEHIAPRGGGRGVRSHCEDDRAPLCWDFRSGARSRCRRRRVHIRKGGRHAGSLVRENGAAADVLKVGELPVPEPGPGEVRVRVVASGLNPTDVKARAGSRPMGFPRIVPHQDGAGVIEEVGAGVPASRVGERVWMFIVQWQRPWGTAAEYTVVPAALAVTLPPNTGFPEGACLGIPAVTAHRCLFADGSVDGQTVLVTGGAGAVGHYAVQLAKWGARRSSPPSARRRRRCSPRKLAPTTW